MGGGCIPSEYMSMSIESCVRVSRRLFETTQKLLIDPIFEIRIRADIGLSAAVHLLVVWIYKILFIFDGRFEIIIHPRVVF